jgi:hypothetical protein
MAQPKQTIHVLTADEKIKIGFLEDSQPIFARHTQIEKQDVGFEFGEHLDTLVSIRCLAHNLDAVFALEPSRKITWSFKSIHRVHSGEIWLDNRITAEVMKAFAQSSDNGPTYLERADASLLSRARLPNSSGLTHCDFIDVAFGTDHFEAHCSRDRGGKLGYQVNPNIRPGRQSHHRNPYGHRWIEYTARNISYRKGSGHYREAMARP